MYQEEPFSNLISSDNRLNLDQILNNEYALFLITNLKPDEFERLSKKFGNQLELRTQEAKQTKAGMPRKRRAGAGRQYHLVQPEEKLLFLFFYYRFHPTFKVAGELFGVDGTSARRWLKEWEPVLKEVSRRKLKFMRRPIRRAEGFRRWLQKGRWYPNITRRGYSSYFSRLENS